MIVTHRVNFRHFFMLAHIIEYNRQKRYYVLRVPYSLEIRCLFDCRKLFRVLILWNNGLYTLFLTDLYIFYYNFRAVQVFIPSPWKLDVYSKPAFSIEKNRVLAVLLKFSPCKIYRKNPFRCHLWLDQVNRLLNRKNKKRQRDYCLLSLHVTLPEWWKTGVP